jgi:hypothetical protein
VYNFRKINIQTFKAAFENKMEQFPVCILHVINNKGIPLQSFNLHVMDGLLWGKHCMTFYSCCILHELFETRNAH